MKRSHAGTVTIWWTVVGDAFPTEISYGDSKCRWAGQVALQLAVRWRGSNGVIHWLVQLRSRVGGVNGGVGVVGISDFFF